MRKLLLLMALSLLVAARAAIAAGDDWTYYRVRSDDTVEGIAARLKVDPAEIRAMNPELAEKTPQQLVFLIVPRKKRLAPRPQEKRQEPPSAPEESADELPPEDLEVLLDLAGSSSGSYSRAGGVIRIQGEPRHRNVVRTSDGRTVVVPQAPPPPRKIRQLASRRGRMIRGILESAHKFRGVPYLFGGETPRAFDCSGYTQYVFRMHGVRLPRTADIQYAVGRPVPRGKEQPGDLVFFETYAPGASHVGIYLGKGRFLHASSASGVVTVNSLKEAFYRQRYLGARRMF